MEKSVTKNLRNTISKFGSLSSSNGVKIEFVKRYCRNIDEILYPLKPVLDEVVCQISSDEKLKKVLEELDTATNGAKELIKSWNQMMSKIYFVTEIESIIAKLQASLLELCQLVDSLVSTPAASCTVTCVEKLEQIHWEKISVAIGEACRDLAGKVMPKAEILAKISTSLSLSTNQELLMEAVALDKIRMQVIDSEDYMKLDDVNYTVELITHMLQICVEKKQLHSINGVHIPADFCCPLSLELMSDPVIVASGQTYERVFISKWLDLGYSVCPKTRHTIGGTNLIPNYTVKQLIENWCEINGITLPDPVGLLSLSFPASFSHMNGYISDTGPHYNSSLGANYSESPEHNLSVSALHQNSYFSNGNPQNASVADDQIPQDVNGSEANFPGLPPATSEARKISQVSNVDQHLPSRSNGDPGTSATSSGSNLEQLLEENAVAQVSSDSDASEVTEEALVTAASQQEPEFQRRLGEARSGSRSIWRRSSDRTVPRIISPSMDSRHDLSGIETNVRRLIEDLQSDSAELQRAATEELRFLSRHSMENRVVIANCGAIRFLVGLLRSADPKTQENAVTVLLNLSLNDNNKIAIGNAEAVEPLVYVLQTGNPEARENSAATLFSLSVIEENKARIGRSGAIQPLVELLGHGTPRGKKDAATALFNLSILHENKTKIIQAGAVKHLVELMDPATGMVDKAVAVLANLSTVQDGRSGIAQAGGIPLLVQVVELGSGRARENAAAALLQLCTNSNRFCSLVLQEGAVPPLVALSQSGTPRAREKAQNLLSHFRNRRHGNASRG